MIQPTKSAELSKINNRNTKITLSNLSNLEILSNSQNNSLSIDIDDKTNYVHFLKKNQDSLLAAKAENLQELVIQSDKTVRNK